MNSGTGVGFGVSEGVSSNDSSPSQPFGTPPTIELPLAPPEELLEGSNTFTVDGQGGTAVLPKPAIKVEDAPRSQTPVPEVVYVQNGFGGGMVALGVDSEDILSSLSLEKLSDGTFAYVKANKRLYYLSDRLLTGVGTKTGSCRWLRVPAGEDSLSFLTEAQVIKMMESTDSYNRTKWVSISADIDKLRVEYGQATTYLDGKYEQNRSLFEQTATSIRADVTSHKSYVDGKVVDQNSQLLILSNQIATKVSSTEFNPLLGRMTQAESSIIQNAADIRLKASQSVVDGLTTRLSSAEVNIDGAKADILLKAEKSVMDGLLTWKSSAQVDIDGAKGNINMLVTKTDGTNTKLASITIDAADGIKLVAEKVVFSSGKDLPTYISDNAPAYNDTALKEQMAKNLGYDSYNAYYTDAITNGRTIIKNGYLQTSLIDTDAIMAKELVASNMIVNGGKIGDFTVNNKLIGDGYTNGALNGNQIMLDPSNNEIVLAKNGAKRVRLINNELTALALLQVDGGTKYCTTGTTVSSAVTDNALLASKTSLGVGGAGLSKTTYAGINGVTPQLSSLVANITKVPLSSGFYSMDVPYAFNIVHNGLKGDNNTYHRITGTNSATVTVKLMNAAGVVKIATDSLILKVDTEKTGASPVFYGTARFNFAVSAADSYWVEATITVVGGGERPIRYQSWNSGSAFSSGYWSEQYGWNIQYELSLRPGMTIDGSIGLTEISNSGIQSVWTPSRYIRIDGNTANNVFVESKGVWMHNGYTIDFNPETLKTSIGFDPANFATKNYVDTNFYNTVQSDARYYGAHNFNKADVSIAALDVNVSGRVNTNSMMVNKTKVYSSTAAVNDILTMRRYSADYTLVTIDAPPQASWGKAREATLAICRGDNSEYFMDLYNMDYGSVDAGNFLDYGDAKMGLRMQKRGVGKYTPFHFEYGDGTNTVQALSILPNTTSGATNATSVKVWNKLELNTSAVIGFKMATDLNAAVSTDSDGVDFYRFMSTATNIPTNIGVNDGFAVTLNWFYTNYALQLLYDVDGTGAGFRRRKSDGTWDVAVPFWHGLNLNRSDADFTAKGISAASGAFTGNLTAHSGSQVWDASNLNRSDTDFVARNITVNGSAILNHNTKHYLRSGNPNFNGGFYYDTYGDEALLFGFKNPNTRIKFKTGLDFEAIAANSVTGMTNASIDIGSTDVRFGVTAQSSTYSGTGFTATGWGITQDGDANFRNHTVRGKLTTYEFVQNRISIANGNMIVSDNAKCVRMENLISSYGIVRWYLDQQSPFNAGDVVKCKSNGKDYQFYINYVASDKLSIDAYSSNGNNLNVLISVAAAGDLLVRWNSTDAARKGLLYLCSSDAGSPNYQVLYDGAVKAQFGNLEGRAWLGSTLPANTWGLWAENAYLSGAVNATSGKIANTTIDTNRLISIGTSPSGLTMNAAMSVAEVGSANWWSSSNHTSRGFNFNFDTAGRAWSMVMGQMWNSGSQSNAITTSDNYGFQMISHDGYELMAIGASYVNGTNIAFGRLFNGAISGDAAGNVTFADSVKLQWQSGGRNLLPNSKRKPDAQGAGSSTYNPDGTWTITDGTNWNVWNYVVPYQVGEAYTLSIKCKRISGTGGIEVYFRAGDGYIYIPNSENIGSDWKVVSVTRVIQGNNPNDNNNLHFHFTPGSIQVEYIKIEKGYNATDWTPALEDVDSKLTRIDSNGIYTGKIKAENIEGELLSGKTIRATNAADITTLEFHGKAGTITGFSDSGVVLSQLTRNSLTFNDDNGIPGVFLRNNSISLSECKNSGDVYASGTGQIPFGNKTVESGSFTISNVGVYKGTTTFNFSGSLDVSAIGANVQTIVECGLTVAVRADLEWYNTSTGLWESYIEGVCNCIYDRTSGTRSLSFAVTDIPASFSFTTAKTGTFRFRFSHTRSSWGRAWNKLDPDEIFDVEVNYITSVAVNGGAMSGSKLSNGTYIGNNGFISYNGTGSESFLVFDKSKGDIQFMVQANSEVCSLNKAVKLSVNGNGVDVVINGTTKLRVNDSGMILIYGAPAVSTNVDGTGTNRYRLYLDEFNQLCRSPNNGW